MRRAAPEKLVIAPDELFYKLCEPTTATATASKATAAAAAGGELRLQERDVIVRRPAGRTARPFKPIFATSWFGNKVNDVLLVLRLKVIVPRVEVCDGCCCLRHRHQSSCRSYRALVRCSRTAYISSVFRETEQQRGKICRTKVSFSPVTKCRKIWTISFLIQALETIATAN